MPKSIPVKTKTRGRPAGREFPVSVQIRLTDAQAAAIDEWRENQFEHPSRSEAIRQLVAQALKRKRS